MREALEEGGKSSSSGGTEPREELRASRAQYKAVKLSRVLLNGVNVTGTNELLICGTQMDLTLQLRVTSVEQTPRGIEGRSVDDKTGPAGLKGKGETECLRDGGTHRGDHGGESGKKRGLENRDEKDKPAKSPGKPERGNDEGKGMCEQDKKG